ncbi:DUF6817 domain-containing protein [Amorphoplanes digitatis]|uniref:DUF6817 domain-containing protein n=1 Tax=Actinoplanes digitatis TaxID=1868 RepID=A0A7W7MR51_9ACTN|nr:hypothetical protein [Actinoplanes digitatis]MBB4763265.1 hypothetical protein [Actinoplanes digitatis]BFE72317.1 hypothetical protein GCM10020092_056180 [Actinoplanes digitatis]GID92084.1 hypothetical protein Adi01nite_14960 [Actinoplanes digitatis]
MSRERAVREWLRERGAESVDHPGGTLYAHLGRVHDRLGALGHGPDVQLAGLTHAAYGTDGFDLALLPLAERAVLRELVGEPAEALVHLYGTCDRSRSWKALPGTRRVWDRFTGLAYDLAPGQIQPFTDLTIVNELDVVERDPGIAERHGDQLRELFESWAPLASAPVLAESRRVLG